MRHTLVMQPGGLRRIGREAHGLDVVPVDVDADPVLAARHGEHVPVLEAGGEVLSRYFLDEEALVE